MDGAALEPEARSPSLKWLAAIQHAPTAKAGLATLPENSWKRLMLRVAQKLPAWWTRLAPGLAWVL